MLAPFLHERCPILFLNAHPFVFAFTANTVLSTVLEMFRGSDASIQNLI